MSDLRENKRDLHGNRAYGDDYWKESIARPKVEYDYHERDNRDEDRHRGRGGGDDWWREERFDAGERSGKGGFGRGRDDRDGRRGGGDRGDFDRHPPRRDDDRHHHRGGDDGGRDDRFGAGGRGGKGGFGRGRDDRDGERRGGDRGYDDRHPPRRDDDRHSPRRDDDRGPPSEERDPLFDKILDGLKLAYQAKHIGNCGKTTTKILNQFRTIKYCKYPDVIALVEEARRLNLHGRLATALLAWDLERSEAPDGGWDGEDL